MDLVQFQWIFWDHSSDALPPFGAINIDSHGHQYTQVLQYRERKNILEIELEEPLWSEWRNT